MNFFLNINFTLIRCKVMQITSKIPFYSSKNANKILFNFIFLLFQVTQWWKIFFKCSYHRSKTEENQAITSPQELFMSRNIIRNHNSQILVKISTILVMMEIMSFSTITLPPPHWCLHWVKLIKYGINLMKILSKIQFCNNFIICCLVFRL